MSCRTVGNLAIVCFFCLCGGCQQREEAGLQVQVEEARMKIANMRDSLNTGRPFVRNVYDATEKIRGWILAVSNVSLRTDLSLEFAKALLSVDLTNQPYLVISQDGTRREQRLRAVDSYRDHVIAAFWIANENGCPPEITMDFFFTALRKYKEASFSVPLDMSPLPGESREECNVRHNTARKSYDFYCDCMDFIRRMVTPRLNDCLPIEQHGEFRRRLEPYFDFPSKEEFYGRLYPRWKNLPLFPPKQPRQKQEFKKPDEEVEVEI